MEKISGFYIWGLSYGLVSSQNWKIPLCKSGHTHTRTHTYI